MMKRLLVCLLSLCMLVSMFPAAVYADEPVEGEIHHWDEGKVTKDPTCEEEGEMTYTCTDEDCGKVKTEPIAPLGHTPKGEYDDDDYEKPATCTEPGHEKYEHCANCGALIKVGEEGEYEVVDEKAYEIEPIGHNYVEVKAQDPTCVEAGWKDYVHCENPVYGFDAENKEWKPLYLDADGKETFEVTDTPVICGVYEEGHEKVEIEPTGHTPVPKDPNFVPPLCNAEEPVSVPAICAVCGAELKEEIKIYPAEHTWKTVEAKAATCTEDGWTEYKECEVCGKIEGKEVLPALGHDFTVWVGARAGDCTHPGTIAGYKCSRCGESDGKYEDIPAPGHKFVKIEKVEPTCTEPGVDEYYKCSVCGELFTDSEGNELTEKGDITDLDKWMAENGGGYIAPLGHDYSITVIGQKATCETDGVGAYKECSRCHDIVYANPDAKVIPKHGHSNEDGFWPENYEGHNKDGKTNEERKLAELVVAGTEWNDPANEGITYRIDPEDKAKEPTCTEDGYQPAKLCLFCGEVLEPSKVIDKLGHDWKVETPGELPTCTTSGTSDVLKCTRCDATTGGDPIQARGHELKKVELQLPDCENDGHFAYSYCTREGCNYAVAEKQDMIDERLHKEDQKVASLSEKTEAEMPDSGEHPDEFTVPAYNHAYTEPVRPVEPTCTENGIAEGATRCLVCGEVFNLNVIPAKGHTLTAVEAVEATCLEDGNVAYVYCTVCGKAAKGTLDTVKPADITASDILQNIEENEELEIPEEFVEPALGHNPVDGLGLAPTCTEKGRTNGKYCDRCGITLEEQKEIPALGHDFVLKTAQVDPTCTKDGTKAVYECSRCGLLKGGEMIPKKGHIAGPVQNLEPTCEQYGYENGIHCTVCGNELSLEAIIYYIRSNNYEKLTEDGWIVIPTIVNPLGHNLKTVDAVEANCAGEGTPGNVAYVYCDRCGKAAATDGVDNIPAAVTASKIYQNLDNLDEIPEEFVVTVEHDWLTVRQDELREPTCLEAGSTGVFRQCQRCGEYEEEVLPALGHDVVTIAAKEPTCVDEGNIAYVYCKRCKNAVSNADYEADAKKLDDSTIIYEGKTPAPFVLAATGEHKWKHVDAEMATCVKPGHTEGQECEFCHQTTYTETPADFDAYHEFLSTEEELAKIEWTIVNEGDGTPGSGMRAKLCPVCGYVLEVEEYPKVLKGDVNMDGNVSPLDAQLVLQYYVGVIDTLPNMKAADFNEDGNITPKDAQAILNYYLFGDAVSSEPVVS
jgi:hypothetical protein